MTIEEIEELIKEYYAASMKAGLSAYLVQQQLDFYKECSTETRSKDYDIMRHCRECYQKLLEAIKQYKEQK